jgi:hypothetical protein
LSPAEYVRLTNPKTGTEKLLVLGRFLEQNRGVTEFAGSEINKLASEAKSKNIHSQYYTYAVKQGLLRTVGKSKYALTISGEDVVAALAAGSKK